MATSATVGILRALLTLDTAQFQKGVRQAQTGLRAFSKETKQIGLQASELGSRLTRTITLPLIGAGVAVSKVAMDFESSFAGVRKTVNATEAEFARMAQQFRALSKTIPVNVNELNRLGEAAGALGIPKQEIVGFAEVMAKLGVTTNVTSDQAAESIAQIQTIFQAAGKDTDRFASTLVDLGNKGASTEAQILELANRIASAGRAVGMSQAVVLGFSSAIANVGIEAEAGGSAISKVFGDISMAVSQGGDDVAAFAKVAGMTTKQFSKLFKEDAASAVLAFIEGLGKAQKAGGDLNLILTELGFKEIRQARALRDLALSGDNLSKSIQIANAAWRDNSALTEEARKRFETTQAQLTLLWNRLKDVGITIGNALLPLIKAMAKALGDVMPAIEKAAQIFADLPVPIQATAVAMGLMAAAVGPAIFAFGQFALAASSLAGAFTKTGIATKALTALFGGSGLISSVRAAGAAFAGSAVAVNLFTAALAGIVVPLALIKVIELIQQLKGLVQDSNQWRLNALEENAAHMRVLAEASKVAGRNITNLAEANSILKGRIASLQMAAQSGGKDFKGFTIVTDLYGKSSQKAATAANGLATATGAVGTAAKTAGKDVEETANKVKDAGAAYRQFLNEVGEREIEAIKEANAKKEKEDADYRQFRNEMGEQEIRDYQAAIEAKERADAEWRQYQNEIGLRMMEDEAAILEMRTKRWMQFKELIQQSADHLVHAIGGNLGSLLFGGGDDAAREQAKDAKAHFQELKRSGTASAEELTRAFQAWREAESKANSAFADRFKSLWNGIKRALTDVLDQILGYFVKSFLGGMLKALAGTGLGQRVGGWLMKGLGLGGGGGAGTAMDIGGGLLGKVPGLSGLLGLGGGLATAGFSTAAGGTLAASMIAPSIASAAVPAAITSAGVSAGGAAAGGAAAGGGLGATVAGLATNPITIAAAAAIAGGFLLKKLGLFDNSPSDLSRGIFARMRMKAGATESELPEWIRSDESTMRKIREGRLFGPNGFAPRPFTPAISASAAVPSTAMQRVTSDEGGGAGSWVIRIEAVDAEGIERLFNNKLIPLLKREVVMPRHGLMPLIQQRVLS